MLKRQLFRVGEAFPLDFTIQVSNDNTNWTTVVTQTNYAKPGNSVQASTLQHRMQGISRCKAPT